MRLIGSSFLLILLHAVISSAFAATAPEKAPVPSADTAVESNMKYYVSETGHDANSGKSQEKPFRSIQRAADLTKPGDIVYIMNGTYTKDEPTNNIVTITRSGKDNAFITYQALPGHIPKLKSKNMNAIKVEGASYIIINGLELEGNADNIKIEYALSQKDNKNNPATSGNGICICGKGDQKPHHIIVSNCKIYKFCGGGITSKHADYLTFEGNKIYENAFYSPHGDSGISICQNWNSDSNTGYKMIIRRNVIRHNQNLVPSLTVGGIAEGNGIAVDDLRNSRNNSKLGAYNGRTLIENNLIYCNGGRGIYTFYSDEVDVVNNTMYQNSQNPKIPEGEICVLWGNGIRVLNNIIYASKDKPATTVNEAKATIFDYNLSFNGKLNAPPAHNVIDKNPLFIDEEKFDFTLQRKSPAINAGTSELRVPRDMLNVQRPQGPAVDIGAFEKKQ